MTGDRFRRGASTTGGERGESQVQMQLGKEGRGEEVCELIPIAVVRQVDVPVGSRQEVGADDQSTDFARRVSVDPPHLGRDPEPQTALGLDRCLVDKDIGSVCGASVLETHIQRGPRREPGGWGESQGEPAGAASRFKV